MRLPPAIEQVVQITATAHAQAFCEDLPIGLGARLTQRLDEALAVGLVMEDQFTAVAPAHDVVNRPGIFDSQFAGHARTVAMATSCVNIKN